MSRDEIDALCEIVAQHKLSYLRVGEVEIKPSSWTWGDDAPAAVPAASAEDPPSRKRNTRAPIADDDEPRFQPHPLHYLSSGG